MSGVRNLLGASLLTVSSWACAGDLIVEVEADDPAVARESVVYAIARNSENGVTRGKAERFSIDQRGKEFIPLVSVVRIGTSVEFPNSDDIRHQVYSFSPAKTFNLKLYSGRPAAPVVFDKLGVVTLGCNIHDRMIAWVMVVDTPWVARTNKEGAVQFALPEGEYDLHVWHPGINSITHAATVSLPIKVEAERLTKTVHIGAMSVAKLRQQAALLDGRPNTIAPPGGQ